MLPLIGMIAYLTPFFAVTLVYQTILRGSPKILTDFIRWYLVVSFLFLTTLYLEYIGYDWSVLGEVGEGIIIFDKVTGAKLSAYSGLFRSSEVAAWHAATWVCFFAIWIINRRITLSKTVLATSLVLVVVGLGIITGRRKFLLEIVIFASMYTALLLYFARAAKLAVLASVCGLTGYLAFILFMPDTSTEVALRDLHTSNLYTNYVSRTKGVFGDIPDRFTELGLAPVTWAYNSYGLLGAGLGVGSQGTQHFGAVSQGAAEGGLGKIWLEVGAPGFIIIAWLGWAMVRHIWRILNFVSRRSKPLSRISCGLTSFLVANLATFAVATQIYGDMFVLLLLGTALGSLMAMPVLAERIVLQKWSQSLTPNVRDLAVTEIGPALLAGNR